MINQSSLLGQRSLEPASTLLPAASSSPVACSPIAAAAFADLVFADQDLLQAEFDAIISANFPEETIGREQTTDEPDPRQPPQPRSSAPPDVGAPRRSQGGPTAARAGVAGLRSSRGPDICGRGSATLRQFADVQARTPHLLTSTRLTGSAPTTVELPQHRELVERHRDGDRSRHIGRVIIRTNPEHLDQH